MMSKFYISITLFVQTFLFVTQAQHAPVCVTDCSGLSDGNYPACGDCMKYVSCSNGDLYNMPCPSGLQWNDNMNYCDYPVYSTCNVWCDAANLVSRDAWGARSRRGQPTPLNRPLEYVVIHHTSRNSCSIPKECEERTREVQDLHMDRNGWDDTGYNFHVGGDGQTYYGRGWDQQGAHSLSFNHRSYGISVLGDFVEEMPNALALQTVQNLINCGISKGHITPDYTLHGHKDVRKNTDCPGGVFFDNWVIKHPHYQTSPVKYRR